MSSVTVLRHDLKGKRFGKLFVKERDLTRKPRVAWLCECECGKTHSALSHNLLSGSTTHCGCSPRGSRARAKNGERYSKHVGSKSGRLVAIEYLVDENGKQKFLCLCDCGAKTVVQYSNFVMQKQKSCGCLGAEARRTHGMSTADEYRIWNGLRRRCNSPKDILYSRYGGKGIRVTDRWSDFKNFYADMGPRPSSKHRILLDPDAQEFSKETCRWGLPSESLRTRGRKLKHRVEIDGQMYSIAQAARLAGISRWAMHLRIKAGITGRDLVSGKSDKPVGRKPKYLYQGKPTTIREIAEITGVKFNLWG